MDVPSYVLTLKRLRETDVPIIWCLRGVLVLSNPKLSLPSKRLVTPINLRVTEADSKDSGRGVVRIPNEVLHRKRRVNSIHIPLWRKKGKK